MHGHQFARIGPLIARGGISDASKGAFPVFGSPDKCLVQ